MARKEKLPAFLKSEKIQTGTQQLFGAGVIAGAALPLTGRKGFKVIRKAEKTFKIAAFLPTKGTRLLKLGALGLGALGVSNILKGKKELPTKKDRRKFSALGTAIVNPVLGQFLGSVIGVSALVGAGKFGKFIKARRTAKATSKAAAASRKRIRGPATVEGRTVFRRIKGRIIPIKLKDVGPKRGR